MPGHHGQGQKGKRWPPCQGQTSSRQDAEFCLMKAWSQTKTNACALYVRVGVEFLCTFACAKESGSHAPQDPVKSFLCLKTQGIQTHSWWDETGPRAYAEAELGETICSQRGDPGLFSLAFYFRNGTVLPGEPLCLTPTAPPWRTQVLFLGRTAVIFHEGSMFCMCRHWSWAQGHKETTCAS